MQCPWFLEHKPTPGWTAERRDINVQHGTHNNTPVESYIVKKCAMYIEDEKMRKENRIWDGPYWDAPVCIECHSRDVCIWSKCTCNKRSRDGGY